MDIASKIIHEIERTFASLGAISNQGFYKTEDYNISDCTTWIYRSSFPSYYSQSQVIRDYFFIIPHSINFQYQTTCQELERRSIEEYYIVDIFGQFEGEEKTLLPRVLYKYFFDVNRYEERFAEVLEKQDIENNYVAREPRFLIDLDNFKEFLKGQGGPKQPIIAQNLLQQWASQETGSGYPLLVLGERGIGKSWLVKKFVLEQNKRHKQQPWINPPAIYISLRDLSKEKIGERRLIDLIRGQLADQTYIKIFTSEEFIRSLIVIGKVIIVLDGLDEITKEFSDESFRYNLWEIFSVTNNITKLIITSRTNQFKSRQQIYEYFAFSHYSKTLEAPKTFNVVEREYRRDFNIWELGPLRSKEYHNFFNKYREAYFEKGKEKLQKIEAKYKESGTIQYEIFDLSKIPAFFPRIVNALGSNDYQLIDIIKFSIDETILEYNIYTDRAIFEFNLIKDGTIQTLPFDKEIKSNLIEEIAWYMYERQTNKFNLKELRASIHDLSQEHDYEILVNDIKTQTFIKLVEGDSFTFISEGIYAYLVSRTFLKFWKSPIELRVKEGISKLGLFDMTSNSFRNRILVFLKIELDNNPEIKERIQAYTQELTARENALFAGFRYLNKNFTNLELKGTSVKKLKLWAELSPLLPEENYGIDLVLIPENGTINYSYFISSTEITNLQFYQFLSDPIAMTDLSESLPLQHSGIFWERHGEFWQKKENPFFNIINEYHLIHWKNGRIPKNLERHPVVWVCWFACAQFCNWLSHKHGLEPSYLFEFENNKFKRVIIQDNPGYRLPYPEEWRYAAAEGNTKVQFLWDLPRYQDEQGKLSRIGEAIKRRLEEPQDDTIPVKTHMPNAFGLYNLMGNVREWVDGRTAKSKKHTIGKQAKQMIKGSGWLLDKDGLMVNFSNWLFAQSNNLDIGFRIARNLTKQELKIYSKYRIETKKKAKK